MSIFLCIISWCDIHQGFASVLVGIIAASIAIVGWYVNAKFQKDIILGQLTNSARLEIVKSLREYQDWLNIYINQINLLLNKLEMYQDNCKLDWNQELQNYTLMINKRPLQWDVFLEENEILFSKISDIRIKLSWRDKKIGDFALWFQNAFFSRDDIPLIVTNNRKEVISRKKQALKEIDKSIDYIYNQICLIEDIRIYLHNECLSKLTGNKIPVRKPPDKSVPRIIKDSEDNLRIINENDSIQLMNVLINEFSPK